MRSQKPSDHRITIRRIRTTFVLIAWEWFTLTRAKVSLKIMMKNSRTRNLAISKQIRDLSQQIKIARYYVEFRKISRFFGADGKFHDSAHTGSNCANKHKTINFVPRACPLKILYTAHLRENFGHSMGTIFCDSNLGPHREQFLFQADLNCFLIKLKTLMTILCPLV